MDDNHLYTIGWIAPMPLEHIVAMAALDETYSNTHDNDGFMYSRGRIGPHNIVVAVQAKIGTNSAADLARRIKQLFKNVDRFLVVGIAGGVPSYDPAGNARQIVLGDVVVSSPWGNHGGTVKILAGRLVQEESDTNQSLLQIISHTNAAPDDMLTAVRALQSAHARLPGTQIPMILKEIRETMRVQDQHTYEDPGADIDWLFDADYVHPSQDSYKDCRESCEWSRAKKRNDRGQLAQRNTDTPEIHYGNIGSSNALQMNAKERDRLRDEHGILAYEMEGVGVAEGHHCLVIRGICDYSDSHKNKHWQPYAAITAAAYAKELLGVLPPRALRHTENQSTAAAEDNPSELYRRLLDSLAFKRQHARRHNVTPAFGKTCQWIFQHIDFKDWRDRQGIEEHHGLLWIRGKPGSGKSTLMKVIHEYALKNAQKYPDRLIVTFFFNARAKTELERSSMGMYRSIIHQILEQMPSQRDKFTSDYHDKLMRDTVDDWTIPDLQAFLRHVVHNLGHNSLEILLDALDEAEEKEVRALVTFLEDLCRIATENKTVLWVCLSSRHYRYIRIRTGSKILILEDAKEHDKDIVEYTDDWLSKYGDRMRHLRPVLLRKAKGIFLWVILATCLLEELDDDGEDQDQMQEHLKHVPQELDDLFSELVTKNTKDIDETIMLFQCMLFANRVLEPTELYLAIRTGSKLRPVGKLDMPDKETMQRFLLSRSRGLVEVVLAKDAWGTAMVEEVHFIHETVPSFLLSERGLPKLQPALSENLLGLSHDKLRSICFQYILDQLVSQISQVDPGNDNNHQLGRPPPGIKSWWDNALAMQHEGTFLNYAVYNLIWHANTAETAGVSQHVFLGEVTTSAHGYLPHLLWHDWNLETYSALDFAVASGCPELIRSISTPQMIGDIAPVRQAELLQLAAKQGYHVVCKLLLEYGIDPNVYGGSDGTALNAAASRGRIKVVRLLLDKGADVNSNREPWGTALIQASYHRRLDIVKLLIQHNADLNLRNLGLGSALDAALRSSYVHSVSGSTIEYLVENGAERPTDPNLAHRLQVILGEMPLRMTRMNRLDRAVLHLGSHHTPQQHTEHE